MEIEYKATRADFRVLYDALWRDRRSDSRQSHLSRYGGLVLVTGLAVYVSLVHEEIFIGMLFLVLGGYFFYVMVSFNRAWREAGQKTAYHLRESMYKLALDEAGGLETYCNLQLRVPWSEIHAYEVLEERLFIHFGMRKAFMVPLRELKEGEREGWIGLLEQHGVHVRE